MKGAQVSQFHVGQQVAYSRGKLLPPGFGTIVKLHKSCRAGVAEIRTRGRKVARRLQHVWPCDVAREIRPIGPNRPI